MSRPRPHLRLSSAVAALPPGSMVMAKIHGLGADGTLEVDCHDGVLRTCLWLENAENGAVGLATDDVVLVLVGHAETPHVVLGRVGPYGKRRDTSHVKVQASESLTLECGEASIDLRADGKVVIKGEDVLVRAKGTKRIRAGSVSIN